MPHDDWTDGDAPQGDDGAAIPPNDEHAERAIVASMLIDALLLGQALALLRPEHFFHRPYRTLFEAMLAMHLAGEPVDAVTLMTRLRETGRLGELGAAGLPGLLDGVAAVGNVGPYARAIRDAWRLRCLLTECQRWTAEARHARGHRAEVGRGLAYAPAQSLLECAARTLDELASDTPLVTAQDGAEVMAEAFDFLAAQSERARERGMAGVSTGFEALDRATGGLHGGDLVLLGALPSMGKTALLTAIAMGAAESGTGVAFFTLEMSARDIALRAACARAGVSMADVRGGAYLAPSQSAALAGAMNDIAALPITWDGLSSRNAAATVPNVQELMAKAMRAASAADVKRRPRIGLVIVDYLQRIRPIARTRGAQPTREEAVAESAKGLKLLATRLGVPVVCAAALNRTSAAEGRKPAMRDLRESGAAEYEADGIWLLHRDDYKRERDGSTAPSAFTREAEVIIAKMRNAGTGTVLLGFDREFTRFRELPESAGGWADQGPAWQ